MEDTYSPSHQKKKKKLNIVWKFTQLHKPWDFCLNITRANISLEYCRMLYPHPWINTYIYKAWIRVPILAQPSLFSVNLSLTLIFHFHCIFCVCSLELCCNIYWPRIAVTNSTNTTCYDSIKVHLRTKHDNESKYIFYRTLCPPIYIVFVFPWFLRLCYITIIGKISAKVFLSSAEGKTVFILIFFF